MTIALAVFLFLLGPIAALAPLGLAWMAGLVLVLFAAQQASAWRHAALGASFGLRCLIGFIVFAAISLAWTAAPGEAAGRAAATLPLILLAATIATAAVRTRDNRPGDATLARAFVAGMVLGLGLMLIELLFDQPLRALFGGEVTSMSILRLNRSAVAFACFVWPAALLLVNDGRPRTAFALAVAATLAIFLSESQSAQLGLLVGALVFPLALWRERIARGLVALLPVLAALVMVPAAQVLRWFDVSLAAVLPLSFRQRIEIWDFTARRVGENLWFGHGLDASRNIANGGEVSAFQAAGNPILPLHPHNAFLQLWLELGLVGVALMVAGLTAAVLAVGRLPAAARPFALAAAASALAMLAVAYGVWQGWWVGTLTLTLALCAWAASRGNTGTR
jgi:O-antigen ligase